MRNAFIRLFYTPSKKSFDSWLRAASFGLGTMDPEWNLPEICTLHPSDDLQSTRRACIKKKNLWTPRGVTATLLLIMLFGSSTGSHLKYLFSRRSPRLLSLRKDAGKQIWKNPHLSTTRTTKSTSWGGGGGTPNKNNLERRLYGKMNKYKNTQQHFCGLTHTWLCIYPKGTSRSFPSCCAVRPFWRGAPHKFR